VRGRKLSTQNYVGTFVMATLHVTFSFSIFKYLTRRISLVLLLLRRGIAICLLKGETRV